MRLNSESTEFHSVMCNVIYATEKLELSQRVYSEKKDLLKEPICNNYMY